MLLAERYRIEDLLGSGGMGTVHAGFDTLLERRVAIKFLPSEVENDARARTRFRREALAAAALDHPYICKIFEVGEHQGRSFIVMERIDGETLDASIASRALSPRQVLDLAHELAQALDEAHRRGIVHRDLKPSNIMLTTQGHVKVLDFGLAKSPESDEPRREATAATAVAMTLPGTRLGTPSYMSPEQVLGSPLDSRSDIFSLGVVLHELASGVHPFRHDTATDTMASILRDVPRSTEGDLDVVPGFGRIVHRMLAKACAERFQSMREVTIELDALRERGTSGTPGSGSAAALIVADERTPMVARDGELAELVSHLDRMLLGHGGMVLLGGEPGVGKTRLARELQRIARERGCVALTGHCYEQEGAPPLGPFIETLEQVARAFPQAMRISMGDVAPEMATLVPELRRHFPDISQMPPIDPEQQRRVLFSAYLTYTQRATAKSAGVVLFDDLHWADEASVQLLQHLASHLSSMRLLVIGTYRDVDLDASRPFARALENLVRQRQAVRVGVRRLDKSGVRDLLRGMSGFLPPESLVDAVYQETDGNPFFVEEVFQHLKEEGRLFDREGRWKSDLRIEDIDVPEGVRLVITRRLQRLGVDARKVLTAAAVIGRTFPLDLLTAVADQDEETLLDLLDDAVRAQILYSERGRNARYSFVHELIRSTLLTDLSLPRRQRLHVRVADAIEQLRASSLDAHASSLAHHLYQAGAAVEQDRAVAALARAVQRAVSSGAYEEALALADQLESLDVADDFTAAALIWDTRVRCNWALARFESVLAPAERLLELGLRNHDYRRAAQAAERLGQVLVNVAKAELSLPLYERVLAAIPKTEDYARALTLGGYALALWGAGQLAACRAAAEEALALGRELGDPSVQGAAICSLAWRSLSLAQFRESLRLTEENASIFQAAQPFIRRLPVITKSALLPILGLWNEIDRFEVQTIEEARALEGSGVSPVSNWFLRSAVAEKRLALSGALPQYLDCMERELSPMRSVPGLTRNVRCSSATARLYAGEADRAIAEMIEALGFNAAALGVRDEANLMAMYAWADQIDDARRAWAGIADEVLATVPGNELHWRGLGSLGPSALALTMLGDVDTSGALYPALERLLASGSEYVPWTVGPLSPHLAAAVSAASAGLGDRARDHFEQALEKADTLPHRLLQPSVRLWFGRFLARQSGDDRTRGLAMLRDAAEDFRSLAMPLHQARAERWLSEGPTRDFAQRS
jgi:tRNA A-37 threonylcarbamoyl transferase component Bud32/tetratricopeptide (TPR) repeat protein